MPALRLNYFGAWVVVLLSFSAVFPAASANDKKAIKVVTELFEQFQFIDGDNHLRGYSVEVVEALFGITQDDYHIEVLPWSVAFKKAQEQENVMIFSIARDSNRENNFHWVGKLYHEPIFFWSLKDLFIDTVTELQQLRDYTVAVVKDANSHQYLVKHAFPNIYLMTSTFSNIDARHRIKMLNGDRAHIVIASERDILATLQVLGYQRDSLSKVFHDPALDNNLYIAFGKGAEPALVAKYQAAFTLLRESGQLAALKAKWQRQ